MKKINKQYIRSLIVPRKKDAHKGDFGHVLIIAGSRGMTGAAILCANGALRGGAGLVTVAIPESQQKIVASNIRPEAMTLGLEEKKSKLSVNASRKLLDFIKQRKVSSIVLGPGIGRSPETKSLVKKILSAVHSPIVLDADGLNAISGSKNALKSSKAGLVLTPHAGELSRLAGIPVKKINGRRAGTAESFARSQGIICVLKGHNTVISDGKNTFENSTGNPGMATGGTGDVLSGLIGALISQVKEPRLLNAALAGVYLHGLAGDIAAKDKTQAEMLAKDVAENIPKALKAVVGRL